MPDDCDDPFPPHPLPPARSSVGVRRAEAPGRGERPGEGLPIGFYTSSRTIEPSPMIVCDDPTLRRFAHRPEFRAYLARQVGTTLSPPAPLRRQPALIPLSALMRHALIVGGTGGGKTRLLLLICRLLVKRGYSMLLVDPKGELADLLLAQLAAEGVPSSAVTLLDPRRPAEGIPGCNPFLASLPLMEAVTDFLALVKASATSWGPRLEDLLTNALIVIASHRLSVDELVRFLANEAYRTALLGRPLRASNPLAFAEACRYFEEEFGAWSRSERVAAVAPVLNKLRELLRSAFLRALLCSRTNTLDLGRLWEQPGVLIVRLDRVALGEEGSRQLAGLVTNLLYRTSQRARRGGVPVALVIDEVPRFEAYVGGALTQIVTTARSQGLACLVALQHLAQLSPDLRETLLANCAVQCSFALGPADAQHIARSLAVGTKARVTRVAVSVGRIDRHTGLPEMAEWRLPIRDAFGRPLRVEARAWQRLQEQDRFGGHLVPGLHDLARAAGVPRLYVATPETGQPIELRASLVGLRSGDYRISGPVPLELLITFPRPHCRGIERWSESDAVRAWMRTLMDLAVQHTVLRLAGEPPEVIRVTEVPTPRGGRGQIDRFLAASRAANGQSAREIRAAYEWRQAEMQQLIRGGPALNTEGEDGSID